MIRNDLKIAIRNLWRNRSFSIINIFGLAIGIGTCLVILLFIQSETSFDRYNTKADQIVRVVFRGVVQGQKMNESHVMPPVAQALKAEFPEVLEATRLRAYGKPRIEYGDKIFRDEQFAFVDSNFFQVFTIPLLQGDAKTALIEPNTVVISKATAEKFFGKEDPIGKSIRFKDANTNSIVTGVFGEIPEESHFRFEVFGSMSGLQESRNLSWMQSEFFTYLVLPKGYDYKKLEAKLPAVTDKYMGPQLQQAMGITLAQFREKGNNVGLTLQQLTDIHLHSNEISYDLAAHGDIRYIYIFGAIAAFMLIIACINFMNLSTASASKRAKEVGIRKVLGSLKKRLIGQFITESMLLTFFSLLVALVFVYMVLPLFNELAGKNLVLDVSPQGKLLPALLIIGVITGLLAGSYPAFFLSSFNPITVLKGKFTSGKGSTSLRGGLVVFQFFISITLIISTSIVYRQLSFIQNKKLGFEKDQVLVVQERYWLRENENAFKQMLLQDPQVQVVSSSGYLPVGETYNNNFFVYPDGSSERMTKTLRYDVDENYLSALGMELSAGRNFSQAFGTDSSAAIINQTAAAAMGWKENAIGKNFTHQDNEGLQKTYHVVGVVKDFHFSSLHESISPLVMVMSKGSGNFIVKTKAANVEGLLARMKKNWNSLTSEAPFSYSFLDERFEKAYKAEKRTGIVLGIFTALTIFVACLGLFGLATFTAVQRTKEIGIRKVLGASEAGIVQLLSKDFLKLVMIAFVISAPVSWFVMNKWLQDFAYRIPISWWIFVLAMFAAALITIITVSFQAIKAALANPVDSLKNE